MNDLYNFLKSIPFKNVLAIPLLSGLIYLMVYVPTLHDSIIVLLTLIVKYYYDTSTGATQKDATIAAALGNAQQTPAVPVK